jgi:hypothetical protein
MQEPVPDSRRLSLHLGFATEGAGVLGMLADFNFLHHFPEGGLYLSTVPAFLMRLVMSL